MVKRLFDVNAKRHFTGAVLKLQRFSPQIFNPIAKIHSELQAESKYKNIILVDDNIMIPHEPVPNVVNEIMNVLLKSGGYNKEVKLEDLLWRWEVFEKGNRDELTLHRQMIDVYQPILKSQPDVFLKIFKRPDLNLEQILRNYYMKQCDFQNKSVFKNLFSLPNSHTVMLQDETWDLIGMDYTNLLKTKLPMFVPWVPYSITDLQSHLLKVCKTDQIIDCNIFVIGKSDQVTTKLRAQLLLLRITGSIIKLHENTDQHNPTLKNSLKHFKFFESLSDFSRMDQLYCEFLTNSRAMSCNYQELNDIIYLLNRASLIPAQLPYR